MSSRILVAGAGQMGGGIAETAGEIQRIGGGYGVATICSGGGQGEATLIRVD
ncbi:MAG: hypothetical protein M1294_08260 [Firmicutes bacterium]|nr:hypothetical protein [Bacillota bacterium]